MVIMGVTEELSSNDVAESVNQSIVTSTPSRNAVTTSRRNVTHNEDRLVGFFSLIELVSDVSKLTVGVSRILI